MLKQIKASAGSGKTYTLTRDFLRLLKEAREAQAYSCRLALNPSLASGNFSSGDFGAEYSGAEFEFGELAKKAEASTAEQDFIPDYAWSDILAVTFTNKAAAEMKGRILRTLKEFALQNDAGQQQKLKAIAQNNPDEIYISPKQAKSWLKIILSRYTALNIRTIDSLLTQLSRLSALDLHLPPDFEPAFSAKDYFEPVYDVLVSRLGNGDQELRDLMGRAVKSLLLHTNKKGFILRSSLVERLHDLIQLSFVKNKFILAHDDLDIDPDFGANVPADELGYSGFPLPDRELLENSLKQGHLDFIAAGKSLAAYVKDENLSLRKYAPEAIAAASNHKVWSVPKHSEYYAKFELDSLLLKKSQGLASDEAEYAYTKLSNAYDWLTQEGKLYSVALANLPFVALAIPLIDEMRILQEQHGKVPMERIYSGAGAVLGGNAGVSTALCRLGVSLTHVLIDEFQDTSRSQWLAVAPLAEECLSRGGSLTYVGDVKQAIYAWRGGDAALFDEIPEEVGIAQIVPSLNKSELRFNWRSSRAVVEFNNNFFRKLADLELALDLAEAMLPKETPPNLLKETADAFVRSFKGAEQQLPDRHEAIAGLVRLNQLEASNKAELDELVRAKLHETLRDVISRRGSEGIAILARGNKEAGKLAAWVSEIGLPVVTSSSFLLSESLLVQQLICFLRFLEDPSDELAFWNFISAQELFAQEAGLSQNTLFAWLGKVRTQWGKKNNDLHSNKNKSLAFCFKRDYPELWQNMIAPFYARAGFMNTYDCVAEALRCFKVLERNPHEQPYVARFLELINNASELGQVAVSDFLIYWEDCKANIRLPAPEDSFAVRILTIHDSKGLEFPVLIIPYHDFSDKAADRDQGLIEFDLSGQLALLPCIKEAGEPWFRVKMQGALECMNLIYVAWTRAVDEAHLFFTKTTRSVSASQSARGLALVLKSIGIELENGASVEFGTPVIKESPHEKTPHEMFYSSPDLPDDILDAMPTDYFEQAPFFDFDGFNADLNLDMESDIGSYIDHLDEFGDFVASFEAEENYDLASIKQSESNDFLFVDTFSSDSKNSSELAIDPAKALQPMQWLPRLKIFRNQFEEFKFTPKRRGLLVHACLENLHLTGNGSGNGSGNGIGDDIASQQHDAQAAVRLGMSSFPLPIPDKELIISELEGLLFWLISSVPELKHWLRYGANEQTIIDEQGTLHRVDLLVDDGQSICVVEYKTGQPEAEHIEQVKRYLSLLEQIANSTNNSKNNPVKLEGVLVYLDEQKLEKVYLHETSETKVKTPAPISAPASKKKIQKKAVQEKQLQGTIKL